MSCQFHSFIYSHPGFFYKTIWGLCISSVESRAHENPWCSWCSVNVLMNAMVISELCCQMWSSFGSRGAWVTDAVSTWLTFYNAKTFWHGLFTFFCFIEWHVKCREFKSQQFNCSHNSQIRQRIFLGKPRNQCQWIMLIASDLTLNIKYFKMMYFFLWFTWLLQWAFPNLSQWIA